MSMDPPKCEPEGSAPDPSATLQADEPLGAYARVITGQLPQLLAKATALVDAVSFDDNGAMVAGKFVGGSGGLLSRETIAAADALRLELDRWTA